MSGWWQIPTQHQSTYLRGPESASIEIPSFRPHFIKFSKTVSYEVNLPSQHSHLEVLLLSKLVWKGGFQLMQILVLLGMYFDAAVVFITSQLLLFRLALAVLWFMYYFGWFEVFTNSFKKGKPLSKIQLVLTTFFLQDDKCLLMYLPYFNCLEKHSLALSQWLLFGVLSN